MLFRSEATKFSTMKVGANMRTTSSKQNFPEEIHASVLKSGLGKKLNLLSFDKSVVGLDNYSPCRPFDFWIVGPHCCTVALSL